MSLDQVLTRAAALGLPADAVVIAPTPDTVPSGPTGPWVLVPLSDGRTAIGALDRGTFSIYHMSPDDDTTLDALRHLLTGAPQPPTFDASTLASLTAQSADLARDLTRRFSAGERPTAADLPLGTALDHIGPETGHTLFLLGTPFSQRSAPPTDLQLTRTGYFLRTPLPPECGLSPVVAWFNQPGGGLMVTLDRPIRWYTDSGHLQPFAVTPGD